MNKVRLPTSFPVSFPASFPASLRPSFSATFGALVLVTLLALAAPLACAAGTGEAGERGADATDADAAGAGSWAGDVPPQGTFAFVDVNVVPLDEERVVEAQTVVVRGGRIEAMGPAGEVDVPDDATTIDAAGKFLMPGMAEMHGHLPGPDAAEGFTEAVMFLYVANGVTLVRGMQGAPSQLELRDAVERGEVLGPRLYVSSPAMSGNRITEAARAADLVRQYHEAGYDHLKVHEGLPLEVYDALADTANEVGIRFAGHVSNFVGLHHALDKGQATVDHLDNYVEALVDDPETVQGAGLFDLAALQQHVDESRIPSVVEATREAGAGVVPTMALWETFLGAGTGAEIRARRPEVRYMPPDTVQAWQDNVDSRVAELDPETGTWARDIRRRILKALHDGGVMVLFGTDSPQIFSVPGFSIHHEMAVMAESGLTPYEVLVSGTRRVAEYYGTEDESGTVAPGKRADLILVDGNPLDDLGNVARRSGVMVQGRWLPEAEIQARLEGIAATFGAGSAAGSSE